MRRLLAATCLAVLAADGTAAEPGPELSSQVLRRIEFRGAADADAKLTRGRVRRSLASAEAQGMARRLLACKLPLVVAFGPTRAPDVIAQVDFGPSSFTVTLLPRVRELDDPAFGRAFWHEVCHAVHKARAEEAGIYLWDLFVDDELHCRLLSEVVSLELGGRHDRDAVSMSILESTAAFRDAMAEQEDCASLAYEELPDPIAAWTRRRGRLEASREHAQELLRRLPVWRYRIKKVTQAGLLPTERLRDLRAAIDATQGAGGGSSSVSALEADLGRRLALFEGPDGALHRQKLLEFSQQPLVRALHEDMIALQLRYRELERSQLEAAKAPEATAQATWIELDEAYERLKRRDPRCCLDEPPY